MKWEIVLTIIFMTSIWVTDISVTMLNVGQGYLTNGFWIISPSQSYHIGLYLAILSFTLMMFLSDWKNNRRGKAWKKKQMYGKE